ncbi:MAG: SDR family oxidoreductase [Flammeovirgaceae bacterium]
MLSNSDKTLTNSRVLVTGGAGFIGSNLCDVLLAQNNEVICLDNFATGHRHNIEPFLAHQNFTFLEGDIRNFEDCKKAVDGCDYVLHQAALGSVPRSIKDPITSTNVNIGGFVNMLTAAKDAKVKRFVYAASSSTYGDNRELPKIEHRIGNALSPYAITKYVNELYAKNFSELYGLETIGLRYFNVFGKRQDPSGAYAAVIPKFIKLLIHGESPVINGDGSYSRDFTYIDNVILANQLAAITPTTELQSRQKAYYTAQEIEVQSSTALSEIFNVAFGERTTLIELVDYLKESLSKFDASIAKIAPKFGPNRVGDVPHSLASVQKGGSLLAYYPTVSVKDGIALASRWYWENLK